MSQLQYTPAKAGKAESNVMGEILMIVRESLLRGSGEKPHYSRCAEFVLLSKSMQSYFQHSSLRGPDGRLHQFRRISVGGAKFRKLCAIFLGIAVPAHNKVIIAGETCDVNNKDRGPLPYTYKGLRGIFDFVEPAKKDYQGTELIFLAPMEKPLLWGSVYQSRMLWFQEELLRAVRSMTPQYQAGLPFV